MSKSKIKIIAEIGWNHMGNIGLAEKMIKAAKNAGADYAKFQTWQVKNLKSGPWDIDGRREIYQKAEINKELHIKLKKICNKYKIEFLTSLFNPEDYEIIKNLKLDSIKIPSPENRNKKLIKLCDQRFKNIYLSTGASKLTEIKKSYSLFKKKSRVTLMHCVSSYPCDDNIVNLPRLSELRKITKNIGISDHTSDIFSCSLSLMTGVNLIEKHFTIDNNLPGRDNKFAILPEELKQLKNYVDRFTAMNHAYKKLLKSDTEIRKVYTGRWG